MVAVLGCHGHLELADGLARQADGAAGVVARIRVDRRLPDGRRE